jgi:polyprenyl-phospho-N-acetylgalactosaminyl synthase
MHSLSIDLYFFGSGKFMILRGLLSLAAIMLTLYFLKVAQNRPLQKIAMSIPFISILIFAIYPPASTEVAHLLGVGRGVDFVLYLSSFVLLVLSFTLYLNQRVLREQVLLLARHQALQDAKFNKIESLSSHLENHSSANLADKKSNVIVDLTIQNNIDSEIEQEQNNQEQNNELSHTHIKHTWVLIPVYNESQAIIEVVDRLVIAGYSIVLVNDGSQDHTGIVLEQLMLKHHSHQIHILSHPINLGQGAALQTSFDYVQKNLQIPFSVKYIVTFDADGQHSVSDIPYLIEALTASEHIEIALGSRFLGHTINMPWHRRLLLQGAVLFTRYIGGVHVSDSHNGLRALKVDILQRFSLSQARMAHASEFLHLLKHLNINYVEVPVTIEYTEHSMAKGQSALSAINILFDLMIKRIFGI